MDPAKLRAAQQRILKRVNQPDPYTYQCYYVSNRGRSGWVKGPIRKTCKEARDDGDMELKNGTATLVFIVRFGHYPDQQDDGPLIMLNCIKPEAASKIIGHYEDLWNTLLPPEK
jgi:hypothetical protein